MNVVVNILWMIKLHPVIRYLSLTDHVQFEKLCGILNQCLYCDRLITGGRDGVLNIWNYNNGHCLRKLMKRKSNYSLVKLNRCYHKKIKTGQVFYNFQKIMGYRSLMLPSTIFQLYHVN
jgi:hypothetical protein